MKSSVLQMFLWHQIPGNSMERETFSCQVVHHVEHQSFQGMAALRVEWKVQTETSTQIVLGSEVTLSSVSSIESNPQLHLKDKELKLRRKKR